MPSIFVQLVVCLVVLICSIGAGHLIVKCEVNPYALREQTDYLLKARQAHHSGDLVTAAAQYRKYLACENSDAPSHAMIMSELGDVLYAQGDLPAARKMSRDAVEMFDRILASPFTDAAMRRTCEAERLRAVVHLSRATAEEGSVESARKALNEEERRVKRFADDPKFAPAARAELYLELARTAHGLGDVDAAASYIDKALTISVEPSVDHLLYLAIAENYVGNGKFALLPWRAELADYARVHSDNAWSRVFQEGRRELFLRHMHRACEKLQLAWGLAQKFQVTDVRRIATAEALAHALFEDKQFLAASKLFETVLNQYGDRMHPVSRVLMLDRASTAAVYTDQLPLAKSRSQETFERANACLPPDLVLRSDMTGRYIEVAMSRQEFALARSTALQRANAIYNAPLPQERKYRKLAEVYRQLIASCNGLNDQSGAAGYAFQSIERLDRITMPRDPQCVAAAIYAFEDASKALHADGQVVPAKNVISRANALCQSPLNSDARLRKQIGEQYARLCKIH